MKGQQITNIRKAVCIMANELKKLGYSMSAAFKKAWGRIKNSMTVRATGVSFGNRQEILQFIAKFKREDLYITLEREQANIIDGRIVYTIARDGIAKTDLSDTSDNIYPLFDTILAKVDEHQMIRQNHLKCRSQALHTTIMLGVWVSVVCMKER